MEGSSKAWPSTTLFLRWAIRVAREVSLIPTDKTELEAVPTELKLSVRDVHPIDESLCMEVTQS